MNLEKRKSGCHYALDDTVLPSPNIARAALTPMIISTQKLLTISSTVSFSKPAVTTNVPTMEIDITINATTNTIWICDHEKNDVDKFFRTRSEAFDELCDKAGVDSTRLWRKIQRLKGVQAGFLIPAKKEIPTLKFFERFKFYLIFL